jgi:hypothetical protein
MNEEFKIGDKVWFYDNNGVYRIGTIESILNSFGCVRVKYKTNTKNIFVNNETSAICKFKNIEKCN